MNKTKRNIAILALMAIFVFSSGAAYSPVLADGGGTTVSNPPGDPGDGDGGKSSAGKGTKPQSPPPSSPNGGKSWLETMMELLWSF